MIGAGILIVFLVLMVNGIGEGRMVDVNVGLTNTATEETQITSVVLMPGSYCKVSLLDALAIGGNERGVLTANIGGVTKSVSYILPEGDSENYLIEMCVPKGVHTLTIKVFDEEATLDDIEYKYGQSIQ